MRGLQIKVSATVQAVVLNMVTDASNRFNAITSLL
jgi:hypothetical protein